jgi:D-3-phosphoglycerate dehydrogenase / 2-oxoglutarate reductase
MRSEAAPGARGAEVEASVKILLASRIDPGAESRLRAAHDVTCAFGAPPEPLARAIADREVLVFRSGVQITAAVLESAPRLRLIVRAGSGMDNIDLAPVERRRIAFVRIPGPGAQAVAEMAFAMMLALARNLLRADRGMRQGRFAKTEMTGYLLQGKTLGVVGAGNIGSKVGQLGVAWGMRVLGCTENGGQKDVERLAALGIRRTTLDEVLRRSDFVSLHVPLQDSTRNLIDAGAFSRMKRGAFLVNLARGGVVDERALHHALATGHLAGAGVDVHEREGDGLVSPLAGLENVLLTPHIGASTHDSQREIGERIVETIDSFAGAAGLASEEELLEPGPGLRRCRIG